MLTYILGCHAAAFPDCKTWMGGFEPLLVLLVTVHLTGKFLEISLLTRRPANEDKEMVDKNIVYSLVPPSLGCFSQRRQAFVTHPLFLRPCFLFVLFCRSLFVATRSLLCFLFFMFTHSWALLLLVCVVPSISFFGYTIFFCCTCCSWAVGCSSPTHVFSHHPSLVVRIDLGVACANPVGPRSLTDEFTCARN